MIGELYQGLGTKDLSKAKYFKKKISIKEVFMKQSFNILVYCYI